MNGSVADGVIAAALYAKIKDPYDMTETALDAVREALTRQQPLLHNKVPYVDNPAEK